MNKSSGTELLWQKSCSGFSLLFPPIWVWPLTGSMSRFVDSATKFLLFLSWSPSLYTPTVHSSLRFLLSPHSAMHRITASPSLNDFPHNEVSDGSRKDSTRIPWTPKESHFQLGSSWSHSNRTECGFFKVEIKVCDKEGKRLDLPRKNL